MKNLFNKIDFIKKYIAFRIDKQYIFKKTVRKYGEF